MSIYPHIVRPLLFSLEAETAHNIALAGLKRNLVPTSPLVPSNNLKTTILGMDFSNPIGLAAGFDKDAVALPNLSRLGFGFLEAGTVTPKPQSGNPRPRVFRLTEEMAIINRLGFNNDGLANYFRNFEEAKKSIRHCPLGANIGKNKETGDAVSDYVLGVRALSNVADYITVNVSSPNTPGLRDLQVKSNLEKLVGSVMNERAGSDGKPPVFLKIAPDLSEQDIHGVAAVAKDMQIDGLIATNTTISRPDHLTGRMSHEGGGLSGAPLRDMSTQILRSLYRSTEGQIPIIGVGG
ncbi:MAG: quinone-dependent dihydroorotate dehydrogenase, partial [Rhodospirillales bacterium]|nr:quinone-dependent dihydroorotate dehydrogenase [Rhodospirillales bacterium]